MAELKTKPTKGSVEAFLRGVAGEARRKDCLALLRLFRKASGLRPEMWGTGVVGFGRYHYKYPSGREGDWFLTGFAPRKRDLTLYILSGLDGYEKLLARLGKHKTGKGCLYIQRLADVDPKVLEELVTASVEQMKRTYGREE